MDYKNFKYKKYSFSQFKKELDRRPDVYKDFLVDFIQYINLLLNYITFKTFDEYYERIVNKSFVHYQKYDPDLKMFAHVLIDKTSNKCAAYCFTIIFNDKVVQECVYHKDLCQIIDVDTHIGYIKNVVIGSNYRGKKLCNYFISRVKQNAIKNNIDYLLCEINVDRVPQSAKCFTHNGFTQTTIRSYKDSWFFYIKLKKNI